VKNTELTTQLVEEYNLPATDAQHIMSAFAPVAEATAKVDEELKKFTYDEITSEVCAEAKRIRLLYRNARTSGDDIHKKVKANVLSQTKAIDGTRNIYKLHITEREDQLKKIEQHFELLEQKRIDESDKYRAGFLGDHIKDFVYSEDLHLGEMTEEVWQAYYKGKIAEDTAILEAQKKAEQEAKAQAEEQERIRLENIKLKEEREEYESREQEAKAKVAKEEARASLLAKEQDEAKSSKLYLEFLERNGASLDSIKSEDYHLERNGNEFILYKKIDSITIS